MIRAAGGALYRYAHIVDRATRSTAGDRSTNTWEIDRVSDRRLVEAPTRGPVCGERDVVHTLKVRNLQRTVELTRPAPLLMRLMRKKTVLDVAARTKLEGRPARDGIPPREAFSSTRELAFHDHLDPTPKVVLDPTHRAPLGRGMRMARGVGPLPGEAP